MGNWACRWPGWLSISELLVCKDRWIALPKIISINLLTTYYRCHVTCQFQSLLIPSLPSVLVDDPRGPSLLLRCKCIDARNTVVLLMHIGQECHYFNFTFHIYNTHEHHWRKIDEKSLFFTRGNEVSRKLFRLICLGRTVRYITKYSSTSGGPAGLIFPHLPPTSATAESLPLLMWL